MKHVSTLPASLILILIYWSSVLGQSSTTPLQLSFDFRNGTLGWQAGFADYPPDTNINDLYELRAEIRPLPLEIGTGTGFFVQGRNRSDDLFMFLKRSLTVSDGVIPGQRYDVNYTIVFASNACTICGGIGGHPGLSVYLKVGASPIEPLPFGNGQRMNVDKGEQSQGGPAASVAGDIANGLEFDPLRPYVTLQRTHLHTTRITATSAGELWLLVGTDSGFEGLTQLFYQRIDVTLTPVGPSPTQPVIPPTLLAEEGTGRAVALNGVNMKREPFTLFTRVNFGSDQRTRVTFFASNLELLPGEDASAVFAQIEDDQQRLIQMPVEFVGKLPNQEWLTQIVVKMPQVFPTGGTISISLRGATSNKLPISFTTAN